MAEKGFDSEKCLHLEKYLSGVLAASTHMGLCFGLFDLYTGVYGLLGFSWEGIMDGEENNSRNRIKNEKHNNIQHHMKKFKQLPNTQIYEEVLQV